MTKLGKLCCEGGVDKCNLEQQRDEWLQAGAHEDKIVCSIGSRSSAACRVHIEQVCLHDVLHGVFCCSELTAVPARREAWASRA